MRLRFGEDSEGTDMAAAAGIVDPNIFRSLDGENV